MGVRVVLLPFFGKGAFETMVEMDKVGDALKGIGPSRGASRRHPRPRGHELSPGQRADHGSNQVQCRPLLLRRG